MMWKWLEWLMYGLAALSLLVSIIAYAAVIVAARADRRDDNE